MRFPTASKLGQALACPVSCVLPEVLDGDEGRALAAERGSQVHAYLEHAIVDGEIPEEVSAEVRATFDLFAPEDIRLGREVYARERVFSYDPVTKLAVEYSDVNLRNYPKDRKIFFGTADLILKGTDGLFTAIDYKTGTEVQAIEENAQLLFFALCLMRLHGVNLVRVELVFVNPFTGQLRRAFKLVTGREVNAFEERLAGFNERLQEAERLFLAGRALSPTPGTHCKFCACYSICPAQAHLARSLVASPSTVVGVVPGEIQWLSAEDAGRAWEKIAQLKKLLNAIEYELKRYAEQTPLLLSDGAQVTFRPQTRDILHGGIARDVLRELFGEHIAQTAIEVKTTKSSIRKALEEPAKASNESLSRLMGRVLEIIADRGGVKESSYLRLSKLLPGEE